METKAGDGASAVQPGGAYKSIPMAEFVVGRPNELITKNSEFFMWSIFATKSTNQNQLIRYSSFFSSSSSSSSFSLLIRSEETEE